MLRIALDAGYETHEAFTRAFRDAYGRSPSEYRAWAAASGARQPSHRLQAACGLHAGGPEVELPSDPAALFIHHATLNMNVQIQERPELRVAALPHTGPYNTIGSTFARLDGIAGAAGLTSNPDAQMVAVYYDDPETVPATQLRSAAGITVRPGAAVAPPLQALTLPAGRWASALHRGSYAALGDAWQRLLGQWLPESGHRLGAGECYELYLNHPGQVVEADLQTLLYLPLQG